MTDILNFVINKATLKFKYTKHKYYDGSLNIKYRIISPYFNGLELFFDDCGKCQQINSCRLPITLIYMIGEKIKLRSRLYGKSSLSTNS